MRDPQCIKDFAITQHIPPLQRPSQIPKQSKPNFVGSDDHEAAQAHLYHTKYRLHGKTEPSKSFKAKLHLRGTARIEKLNTSFTTQERRDAFDEFLQGRLPIGTAQAIIDFYPDQEFDITIRRDSAPNSRGPFKRRSHKDEGFCESRWLQIATETDLKDYVQLLASRKPSQSSLDESLKIAIRQGSLDIATELLRYGADANTCPTELQSKASNGDMIWTTLLLSSRLHKVDQTVRNKMLQTAVENKDFSMAHLMLSVGADANHSAGQSIISAVRYYSLKVLTLLIANSPTLSKEGLDKAIKRVCDSKRLEGPARLDVFKILLSAGGDVPSADRSKLLNSAVYTCDTAMVALLVKYQQVPSDNATTAMGHFSKSVSEDDMFRTSLLLFAAGAQPLGGILHRAVERDYHQMVALLVNHGVNLDFENASAVKVALRRQDIGLLSLLLHGNSTSAANSIATDTTLAGVLPDALALSTQNKRQEAVRLLIKKGVKGSTVDQALLSVVANPEVCDRALVLMLLKAGASVNLINGNGNCILTAAKDGNLMILKLLIEPAWAAAPKILSEAILAVHLSRTKSLFTEVMETLTLLVQHGADCKSDYVARTLLHAVQNGHDPECTAVVEFLSRQGVNVNYAGGEIIEEALKLEDVKILEALCRTGNINEQSFAHALKPAIDASRVEQQKLRCLLRSCQDFYRITSEALINEVTRGPLAGQDEIVELLLDNSAEVNYDEGFVFVRAIEISDLPKSLGYVRLFLTKTTLSQTLENAFTAARNISCPLEHRYELFQLLLEAGYNGQGRGGALAEVIASDKNDLKLPALLLRHGADVNYGDGLALISAISHGNLALLALLLQYEAETVSVDKALMAACHRGMSASSNVEIFESLLATRTASRECITQALTHVVTHGSRDQVFLGLLSRYKPRITTETLLYLVNRQDIETTRFLITFQIPSKSTRSRAMTACLGLERVLRHRFAELLAVQGLEDAVWRTVLHQSIQEQDTDLLNLVLGDDENRRNEVEGALVLAADTLNPVIVQILLSKAQTAAAISPAFEKILNSGNMQCSVDAMRTTVALLERNPSQTLKDRALLQCLKSHNHDQSDFYKILIRQGADVNMENCICFNIAGQLPDLAVFNVLLRSGANFDLVVKSLVSQFPVEKYEKLIELVFTTVRCETYNSAKLEVDVLLECMRRFGRGHELMRLLLDSDYPAGQTVSKVDLDTGNREDVTPVIWALAQPRPGVSDMVILELLKEKHAKPSFVTQESETSAVILAARLKRHIILERLIELKVDLSTMDASRRSPLFYATTNEDSMSVYMLLENGAQPNDGSLQQAARLCNKGMVALLLDKGHDPDYPCDLHEGRTALGELCSQVQIQDGKEISAAYETMKMLIDCPTDLSFKANGKTILHLALDNDVPIEVTRTLLRFPEIYKDIRTDSEVHAYEDSQGRIMSPDIYVKRYCKSGTQIQSLLVGLLQNVNCKEKWFTKRGDQLAHCKGLPPALQEAKDRQDLADQEARRVIQRRRESAKVELELQDQQHKATMVQNKERTDLQLFNTQRVNDQQTAHENQVAIQRRNHANAERADDIRHTQERDRLAYLAAKDQNALEYSHQQGLKQLEYTSQNRSNQLRYAALEREAGLERKLIESREAAEKRSQSRYLERFARQDESVKLVAQQQRGLIEAAKQARVRYEQEQLALKWEQPD